MICYEIFFYSAQPKHNLIDLQHYIEIILYHDSALRVPEGRTTGKRGSLQESGRLFHDLMRRGLVAACKNAVKFGPWMCEGPQGLPHLILGL